MIPIGTKCIVVAATNQPQHIGKECEVVRHEDWGHGYTHVILIAGERDEIIAKRWHLLPIGHNPDTETREGKREVEA